MDYHLLTTISKTYGMVAFKYNDFTINLAPNLIEKLHLNSGKSLILSPKKDQLIKIFCCHFCEKSLYHCHLPTVKGAPTTSMSWSAKTFTISSFVGGEVHLSVTLKNASILPAGK